MENYITPFTITDKMCNLVYLIAQLLSKIDYVNDLSKYPRLARANRIRSVRSSVAIKNNILSLQQVTDVINGKKVIALQGQITEAQNCFDAYECLDKISLLSLIDLIKKNK